MARSTTYTVPEVPGSKRTSPRPYTHAIIGRSSSQLSAIRYEADLKANGAKYARWDTKNWHDNKRLAECPSGGTYRNHNNYVTTASDELIKIGADFIAKYPTVESYLAHQKAEGEARVAKMKAVPDGELVVLQWSMSHANASKARSAYCKHHVDVRVVECVPVAKTTKA